MDEIRKLAQQLGIEQERNRIAKEFYEYPKRESLPLGVQREIAKIIMVDIDFSK
jgi:hypothetical protein